jgi:hypothetical protein
MFLSELLAASLNKLQIKTTKKIRTARNKISEDHKLTGIIPALQHYVLEACEGVKLLLYDS